MVFERRIHVHDVGLKRTHIKPRPSYYQWHGDEEPMRCNQLINTQPLGNYIMDENGRRTINRAMSAPRMPEWLNKDDEESVNDEETGIEVSYSTLCYPDDM
jgi:hypothetical protein